jgi:hypothetical protein
MPKNPQRLVLKRGGTERVGFEPETVTRPRGPVRRLETSLAVSPALAQRCSLVRIYRTIVKKTGGRYWTRTSDPCDVNTVLYQLS